MPRRMSGRALLRAWAFPLLALFLAAWCSAAAADPPRVIYQSPSPGARFLRPESNVIVRFDRALDTASLPQYTVTGAASGAHSGQTILADDGRTLLFRPDQPFAWGERVNVELESVAASVHEALSFTTAAAPIKRSLAPARADDDPLARARTFVPDFLEPQVADSLPPTFPAIQSTIYSTPAPGMLFLASFSTNPGGANYLLIVDNAGTPMYYKALNGWGLDFKMQPNGKLTYYDASKSKFYEMDSSYAVVDSFACGNGYLTDEHELRLLPNGHALLMSYDGEDVDMSQDVDGGDPQAQVVGCIIQELDQNKNVVFQWRSWDHFQITDATHENMQAEYIDYVHGNALETDSDGNIILSSRHMDEITKIDRQTGNIIWRWGGKHNQFTFEGDTLQFSHQHAIRRLDNGHFVLFDNGNYHTPSYSSAKEYVVDQTKLTVHKIWEFRNTPDTYGFAMGYVQRLANGNTLITWGTGKPNIIEVDPNGQKVMEMTLPGSLVTYRAYRLDWLPATTAAFAAHHGFQMLGNEPNPFRGSTSMTIRLSRPSPIAVHVFDTRGREIKDVVPEVLPLAGAYRVKLDLRGHASGVYLCQVTTNEGTQSQRMVHIQ